ncbi:MAG: hypothetical protein HY603_01300 [Parcubacteria group bacterium]|nr:hypothetical protein [Parcubacteria group bacterium]
MIILTVISILAITCAVWMANKLLPFKVCPICAGVSGTWLWMLAASLLGYQIDFVIVAMLLGGSVVGIAYQLEKKLPAGSANWRTPLLWKTIFIPAGFVAAYGILTHQWIAFLAALAFLLLASFIFLFSTGDKPGPRKETVKELEKKMKDCC